MQKIINPIQSKPDFHPSYERNCWCCWYHCEASLKGIEVQTQKKALVSSTPRTTRTEKQGKDLTSAPVKKTSKKPKNKADDTFEQTSDDEKRNDEK